MNISNYKVNGLWYGISNYKVNGLWYGRYILSLAW
jgi:hypothetical protein